MPWLILLIAGLFEIAWAMTLKSTQGWTRLWPSLATLALMGISFYLLSRAMVHLPAGTAYAVWTGIGTVGVAILGILIFKEPLTAARVFFIALIVAGILGLRLNSAPLPPA